MRLKKYVSRPVMAGVVMLLPSCTGIMHDIYDSVEMGKQATRSGELYIDASDWTLWHYIDFRAVNDSIIEDPLFNPSSLWQTFSIPLEEDATVSGSDTDGIYTYWYDVFGEGIENHEFRSFYPTAPQEEPEKWSIAVHRNNVRTNGGAVWRSPYTSMSKLPEGTDWLRTAEFTEDEWNQTDVWSVQDRMLLGLVGNQGIKINTLLGEWLRMEIPPMPPVYSRDDAVFILRLADGSFAALQLAGHTSPSGSKCHLTINYRYPL